MASLIEKNCELRKKYPYVSLGLDVFGVMKLWQSLNSGAARAEATGDQLKSYLTELFTIAPRIPVSTAVQVKRLQLANGEALVHINADT